MRQQGSDPSTLLRSGIVGRRLLMGALDKLRSKPTDRQTDNFRVVLAGRVTHILLG
jgi:hypothetical protein